MWRSPNPEVKVSADVSGTSPRGCDTWLREVSGPPHCSQLRTGSGTCGVYEGPALPLSPGPGWPKWQRPLALQGTVAYFQLQGPLPTRADSSREQRHSRYLKEGERKEERKGGKERGRGGRLNCFQEVMCACE
jgi:hypothetical protein